MTRDNTAQQEALRQVQELSDAKLAVLRDTIQLRRESGQQAAVQAVRTGRGKKIMDELRDVVAAMENREQQVLKERNEAATAGADRTIQTVAVWMPVALLVLAVVAVVLMRTVRFGGPARRPLSHRKNWGRVAVRYASAVAAVAVAVVLRWRFEVLSAPFPSLSRSTRPSS